MAEFLVITKAEIYDKTCAGFGLLTSIRVSLWRRRRLKINAHRLRSGRHMKI